MDQKNKKNRLRSLTKNNKGIETRVLVYILAAVVLVAAIGIALQATGGAGQLVNVGLQVAGQKMKTEIDNQKITGIDVPDFKPAAAT